MIRKKTGLKELTLVVLCGAALVSVACGDDDDGDSPGTAGSTSAGTKSTGGSAGSKSTGGSAGTGTGGTTSAGTNNGGSGGSSGSSVGGEPNGGVPSDGGTDGEGGTPSEAGADAGGAPAGGAGGEGGAPVVVLDTLKNASFETWNADKTIVAEWINASTPAGASYAEWGAPAKNKAGEYRLAHWSAAAYTARIEQVVSPIANGTYSFSIWVNRAALTELNESYIYAKGFDAEDAEADVQLDTDAGVGDTYVEIKLDNIEVTSGEITVGVFTDAKAEGWINFDAASLERLPD